MTVKRSLSFLVGLFWSTHAMAVTNATILSFSPLSGGVGTVVSITGNGFTGATSVSFGGVQAAGFSVINDQQIMGTVPSGAATGRLIVTTPTSLATSSADFLAQAASAQGIGRFEPLSGSAGTAVTVYGNGTSFTAANVVAVSFGIVSNGGAGVPAKSFSVVNQNTIAAIVADGTPTGLIQVATTGGTATSSTFFTIEQTIMALHAAFENELRTSTPAAQVCPPNADGSGCGITLFGGERWESTTGSGPAAGCPKDSSGSYLIASSFGQPFAADLPYVTEDANGYQRTFADDALDRSKRLLYYSQADATATCGQYCRADAAFRYRDLMYSVDPKDSSSVINQIEARLKSMSDFYGPAERARTFLAEQALRDALKYAPLNRELRNRLLDIYYDRAVAELTLAREKLVNLAHIRLEPPPPGGFLIDREIAAYEQVLGSPTVPGGYRFAEQGYFALFRDPAGVNSAEVDRTAGSEIPFGYYLYQHEGPQRSLYAATYLNGGTPTPVANTGGQPLVAGFKDQVMLFEILADYASAANDLARRYALRGGSGDFQRALSLIGETERKLYSEGNVLLSVFPAFAPSSADPSGLSAAIFGWRNALNQLALTRDFIKGQVNILGFRNDFLMLVQSFQSGGVQAYDSYDALSAYIVDPTKGQPLTDALNKYSAALVGYDTYRGHSDQLAQQFTDSTDAYNARLFKIVGANRGQAGYIAPEMNVGSEIYLQLLSIRIAQNRIQLNAQRLADLQQQILIEIDKRGRERGIENAIADMYVDYGNRQASLTKELSYIKAAQAAANAMAAGPSHWFTSFGASVAAAGVNAAIQAAGEIATGELQARKEILQAQESQQVTIFHSQIADIDSDAVIKTLHLQEATIALESTESALVLTQEIGRLASLYAEKADLERKMDESNTGLLTRYFADPIHRLRMQSSMIAAEESFQEAQKWVFFMARALEYKWNAPFTTTYPASGGRQYSTATVFKARNAQELQDLVNAMAGYNGQAQGALLRQAWYDWFSVKNDFFGFKPFTPSGQPATYADPANPTSPTRVSDLIAFQHKLATLVDANGNVVLNFSTVRELPGQGFFLGPRYDASGNLLSKGTFVDKIIEMQINIPGAYTNLSRSQLTGQLTYGGDAYIRNLSVGTVDPLLPSHKRGEMTAFTTRYWYFDFTRNLWQFNEAFTSPVAMNLTKDPDVALDATLIGVLKERSVAASGWKLTIPIKDLGTTVLDLNEVNDVEIRFHHQAFVRP